MLGGAPLWGNESEYPEATLLWKTTNPPREWKSPDATWNEKNTYRAQSSPHPQGSSGINHEAAAL